MGSGKVAAEAEGVGVLAHSLDAEGDVFVEGDAEFDGTVTDIVAVDTFGESLVFQFFGDGRGFEIEDAFGGADVNAGGEEAGEFVAGEERVLEGSLSRDAAIVGVGDDGADDFLGVAEFAEDFGAFGGMFLVRGVIVVGPALVVEIVKESGEAPSFFVGAVFAGVSADAGFDSQHVFAQGFGLGVFADEFPGIFASRQSKPPLRCKANIYLSTD